MQSKERETDFITTEGTEITEEERINLLTGSVIGAAIEIHRILGPGLLESAYEACLIYELQLINLKFENQKPLPLRYKNTILECGYRLDLIVEDRLLVEVKSVNLFAPIHEAQLLSYMKLSNCKMGLLLNFNVIAMKDGIKRMKL